MDLHILNSFLLATAQESWEYWWNTTRWMLADFLDESGRDAEARTLRTMTCEVADECKAGGISVTGIWLSASSYCQENITVHIGTRYKGETFQRPITLAPGVSFVWQPEPGLEPLVPILRISCEPFALGSVDYVVAAYLDGGEWHGTLSLDRAQKRCRRRVLEMFPEHYEGYKIEDMCGWQDDSPRWVPHEPRGFRFAPGPLVLHWE